MYPIRNIFIRWGVQTEDTLDVKKAMEILDEDHTLPMTAQIHPRHFPMLFKLVDLYF